MSAVLAVLCLLLAAGAVWLGLNISREKRYEKQISLGDKYLEELDYENAKISYENAIEISEKKAVGYVKLAVLYIETGDYEAALETVQKGRESSGEDERFAELQETLEEVSGGEDTEQPSQDKEEQPKDQEDEAPDSEDGEDSAEEEYTIPQERWEMLNDATGIMLWYLGQYDLLTEGEAFTVEDLTNNDVGYMMMIYLDSWDEKQKEAFPALRTEDFKTIYAQETAEYFARSLTGQEPQGVLTGIYGPEGDQTNHLSYENGEYGIPMADGAPVYRTRYLQGIRRGDQVIALVELIEEANVGTTSVGVYQVEYAVDEDSAFGYHFVSMQKLPEVDGAFTRVEASSELQEAGQDHSAATLRDHNLATAWSEGVSGTGAGESITLYADSPQKVHGIRIAPGFYKDRDLLQKNGRPTRLRFTFSDGTELEADLTESLYNSYQYQGAVGSRGENALGVSADWSSGKDWLDFVSFGQEIETEWIKITIVSAQAGSKYEDTCISELVVY